MKNKKILLIILWCLLVFDFRINYAHYAFEWTNGIICIIDKKFPIKVGTLNYLMNEHLKEYKKLKNEKI